MRLFWKRSPTEEKKGATERNVISMLTTLGESYYAWNGKMYESDIIRACIRPKVKAIGKLVGKHIREDKKTGLQVNPDANIRFVLSEPNPYMTGQQMQEKVANQLCLNNNAFILIVRDENGKVVQLYPVPCMTAMAQYNAAGDLFLKFWYLNGGTGTFPYSDIIHLRQDYNESDLFGASPAPALADMMNVIGTIDQGIIKAIKNSGIVRWLLTYNANMREEDIKANVQKFVENYLSVETDSFGAAGVDAKATVQRIEPKDYVPNAAQTDRTTERIYSFFNTNRKIVQSDYNEDEWNAYYEAEIEPVAIQMQDTYSVKLFSRRERGVGNRIVFEANNLQCASITTKLALQAMVDRGAMTPNEWRQAMNMAPVEGGDVAIRRLDTQVVNLVRTALENMTDSNCMAVADIVRNILKGGEKGETQDRHQGKPDPE